MNATGPPQYKRLQALRTVLGLETSHAETSRIQCAQNPVRIGAGSYAVGTEKQDNAQRDDGDPAAIDHSGTSPSLMADGSEGDYGQGQVFPLLNELSERVDALESSMREQKQWNQDFEETVHQIHRSLFGSGTKKGTTRGKATSS
ncbi:hypothetical protein CBS63078_11156 [Aspergillus niger]|nr:hypothetical protein CBS13152_11435 [Aspergillus niger]GLA78867.1 hypothetical protein AtubIFM55763_000760 [Aspergillus tubingensis]KAI2865692.1 hypothetical protein CBS11852_11507 [Aspergillus niger]KAI2885618.1 hypothetical protein CBS63078_11156 [Aspergillus niger]KAI3014032.1 hypothetical protein CBS147347_11540 [Aspergillus niger]